MSVEENKINFKELISGLDIEGAFLDETMDERRGISLWVPETYKEKYGRLQDMSKKRFCRIARAVVMRLIDETESVLDKKLG